MAQLDIKQIRGASQGSGYVLTTDDNGLATWSQSQTITEITISGTQNGSNRNFVLSDSLTYPQNLFFINGQLTQESIDYTISGTALTIDSSIPAPISTDTLRLFGTIAPLLGSGVLSVNGLSNTYQYFTSSSSDGNIDININSSVDTHSFDVNVLFNDSGTSSTDVWSANQIISYVGVGGVGATGATGATGSVILNGLTASLQYFTASNDTNVNLNIDSVGTTHSYQLSWGGVLSLSRGGLSNSTFTASQILIVNSSTSSVVSSGYQFNDSGTSSTDIWSSQRTIQYIETLTLSGARNAPNATNVYLRSGDGLPFNTTPFVLPFDGVIKSISISTSANATWTGEVRNNGVLVPGASLISTAQSATYSSFNVNVDAGDLLQLYMNGTNIPRPRMVVIISKR